MAWIFNSTILQTVIFTGFLDITRLSIFKCYFRIMLLVTVRILPISYYIFRPGKKEKKTDDITLLIFIFLVFLWIFMIFFTLQTSNIFENSPNLRISWRKNHFMEANLVSMLFLQIQFCLYYKGSLGRKWNLFLYEYILGLKPTGDCRKRFF